MSIEQGIKQIESASTIEEMTKGLTMVNDCVDAKLEVMSSSEITELKRLVHSKATEIAITWGEHERRIH